ncbi:MAG: DUF3160 domain-containing protein, partial [Lachnospiraceae bacterium]|nr:DUF3160 domain-containing protein [Lachnospiraceae bacterium]
MRRKRVIFGAVSLSLILGMTGCNVTNPGTDPSGVVTKEETSAERDEESSSAAEEETSGKPEETSESQTEQGSFEETEENGSENETEESETGSEGAGVSKVQQLTFVTDDSWKPWSIEEASKVTFAAVKPKLLVTGQGEEQTFTPSVSAYTVNPDLSNVANLSEFYFSDSEKALLAANGFFVYQNEFCYGADEFFDIYEDARYDEKPCFVTTDSMMHTYHLYYQMLQKSVEKDCLCDELKELTDGMLKKSLQQYSVLKGTEWEEAAKRNVIYFGVAASLFGSDVKVPAEFSESINNEVGKIMAASGFE